MKGYNMSITKVEPSQTYSAEEAYRDILGMNTSASADRSIEIGERMSIDALLNRSRGECIPNIGDVELKSRLLSENLDLKSLKSSILTGVDPELLTDIDPKLPAGVNPGPTPKLRSVINSAMAEIADIIRPLIENPKRAVLEILRSIIGIYLCVIVCRSAVNVVRGKPMLTGMRSILPIAIVKSTISSVSNLLSGKKGKITPVTVSSGTGTAETKTQSQGNDVNPLAKTENSDNSKNSRNNKRNSTVKTQSEQKKSEKAVSGKDIDLNGQKRSEEQTKKSADEQIAKERVESEKKKQNQPKKTTTRKPIVISSGAKKNRLTR
jgi:hypothetical protein